MTQSKNKLHFDTKFRLLAHSVPMVVNLKYSLVSFSWLATKNNHFLLDQMLLMRHTWNWDRKKSCQDHWKTMRTIFYRTIFVLMLHAMTTVTSYFRLNLVWNEFKFKSKTFKRLGNVSEATYKYPIIFTGILFLRGFSHINFSNT